MSWLVRGKVMDPGLSAAALRVPTEIRFGEQRQVPSLSGGVVLHSGMAVSVLVKNLSGNSSMYVGGSGVYSGCGFRVDAGEGLDIDIDNLEKVWLYASKSGEYVSFIGVF